MLKSFLQITTMVLGILGGVFGLFLGIFAFLGYPAVIAGIFGIIGGSIVRRNAKFAAVLMLGGTIIGFGTYYISFAIPGLLLIGGSILSFISAKQTSFENKA